MRFSDLDQKCEESDKVTADVTAVPLHEENEWCLGCLPQCLLIAYILW
jgi:hypothetical protein